MLSPHPADPTLTTDNLMEVVKDVEDCWSDLGIWLVPDSKRVEIRSLYQSDHYRMEAMVDSYVRHHPTPSWKRVAEALQRVNLHKPADVVANNYVKGTDINHVTGLILNETVDGQLYWYLIKKLITSESLKDLMCLGTTWYQLESCRGHGSCLTLYDCKTC